MKRQWFTINEILHKQTKKTKFLDHFVIDGKQITDQKAISNAFNNYFVNIGPNLAANIKLPNSKSFKNFLRNPTSHKFILACTNEENILKIIDRLHPKNSCGPDEISVKLLKEIKHEIIKPVALITNQCILTGVFPDTLKIAKIIPIHKKDDKTQLENYRPISIFLPAISKVIERVIFDQMHDYFHTNKLYFEGQYGFRKKNTTELAAVEMIDRITQELYKGNTPLNIFLDLSKAFDTLDHEIMLYKLEYYGVTGPALQLLRSYLSDRKQYSEFENVKSDWRNIKTGVPQGSILGPLLFVIYVNDISLASKIFTAIIYADDTSLSSTLNTFRCNTNVNTNNELSKISEWLKVNKLSLNTKKTKAMI